MRLPERLPLLVCTVPLLLYAATLSANFNFDGTVFARPLSVVLLSALLLFGWGVS